MNPVNVSSNASSVVQTTGTVPERQAASVSDAATVTSTSVKQSSKSIDAVEESVRPSKEAVQLAAKQIESYVKSMDRDLDFSVDESTGYSVVRVTDPSTGELIRQMPTEETLRIAKAIDFSGSVLVSQKA